MFQRLLIDGRAHSLTGRKLLHAETDDAIAVGDAGGDERRVFGEGCDLDRPQFELTRLPDHVDRGTAAAVEDGGQRQLGE